MTQNKHTPLEKKLLEALIYSRDVLARCGQMTNVADNAIKKARGE